MNSNDDVEDKKKREAHREAVYKWRRENPDKYHETQNKCSLAYYYKNRDEISEKRRTTRLAKKAQGLI
jgi:hypothetical protein